MLATKNQLISVFIFKNELLFAALTHCLKESLSILS